MVVAVAHHVRMKFGGSSFLVHYLVGVTALRGKKRPRVLTCNAIRNLAAVSFLLLYSLLCIIEPSYLLRGVCRPWSFLCPGANTLRHVC